MLTHWGWDEMTTIMQSTFSKAFSWMKMYEFGLRFHWNFLWCSVTSHYLNQWWLDHWRIYMRHSASVSYMGNEWYHWSGLFLCFRPHLSFDHKMHNMWYLVMSTMNSSDLIWLHKACIDGLVQDCSNSIANALELLQSCTKPSICAHNPQLIKIYVTQTGKIITRAPFY